MVKDLKHIALIGWIIITVFYGVRLWITSRTIGLENTMNTIREQSDKLTLENTVLENQISKESSLQVIEQKARNMGFTNVKKVEYIK